MSIPEAISTAPRKRKHYVKDDPTRCPECGHHFCAHIHPHNCLGCVHEHTPQRAEPCLSCGDAAVNFAPFYPASKNERKPLERETMSGQKSRCGKSNVIRHTPPTSADDEYHTGGLPVCRVVFPTAMRRGSL